jgi:hypothetical protein
MSNRNVYIISTCNNKSKTVFFSHLTKHNKWIRTLFGAVIFFLALQKTNNRWDHIGKGSVCFLTTWWEMGFFGFCFFVFLLLVKEIRYIFLGKEYNVSLWYDPTKTQEIQSPTDTELKIHTIVPSIDNSRFRNPEMSGWTSNFPTLKLSCPNSRVLFKH